MTQFFIFILISYQGLRILIESFHNSVDQEKSSGTVLQDSYHREIIRHQLSNSPDLLTIRPGTLCVDAPSAFLSIPKKEEGIIVMVKVS